MPLVPASPASLLAFMLIVAAVIAAYVAGTYVAARREAGEAAARASTLRFVLGLGAWLGAFSLFVRASVIDERPFPLVVVTFAVLNLVAVAYALSPAGRRLAHSLPLPALVGFQAFRLPLEVVLHAWAEHGTIPTSMSWSGANLDVISGVTALVLAPFAARRAVAWVANVVGLALLLNVARVAMLSSPLPFGWDVEPKLTLIAHLPYALIGPVCVAGALAGHIVLTRRLVSPARR
jgi:hypothetical protein